MSLCNDFFLLISLPFSFHQDYQDYDYGRDLEGRRRGSFDRGMLAEQDLDRHERSSRVEESSRSRQFYSQQADKSSAALQRESLEREIGQEPINRASYQSQRSSARDLPQQQDAPFTDSRQRATFANQSSSQSAQMLPEKSFLLPFPTQVQEKITNSPSLPQEGSKISRDDVPRSSVSRERGSRQGDQRSLEAKQSLRDNKPTARHSDEQNDFPSRSRRGSLYEDRFDLESSAHFDERTMGPGHTNRSLPSHLAREFPQQSLQDGTQRRFSGRLESMSEAQYRELSRSQLELLEERSLLLQHDYDRVPLYTPRHKLQLSEEDEWLLMRQARDREHRQLLMMEDEQRLLEEALAMRALSRNQQTQFSQQQHDLLFLNRSQQQQHPLGSIQMQRERDGVLSKGQGALSASGPGDWICLLCSNFNYAKRTHCNRSKCGAPRSLSQQVVYSLCSQLEQLESLNTQLAALVNVNAIVLK